MFTTGESVIIRNGNNTKNNLGPYNYGLINDGVGENADISKNLTAFTWSIEFNEDFKTEFDKLDANNKRSIDIIFKINNDIDVSFNNNSSSCNNLFHSSKADFMIYHKDNDDCFNMIKNLAKKGWIYSGNVFAISKDDIGGPAGNSGEFWYGGNILVRGNKEEAGHYLIVRIDLRSEVVFNSNISAYGALDPEKTSNTGYKGRKEILTIVYPNFDAKSNVEGFSLDNDNLTVTDPDNHYIGGSTTSRAGSTNLQILDNIDINEKFFNALDEAISKSTSTEVINAMVDIENSDFFGGGNINEVIDVYTIIDTINSPFSEWTTGNRNREINNLDEDLDGIYSINSLTINMAYKLDVDSLQFNSDGGGGGSSGDPYCEPIFGNPIKLPNKYANYRLFESQDLYINATVSAATKQDKADIIDYLQRNRYSQNVIEHAIYDGFFYDTFYISYKGASIKMDMNTLQKEIVNKDFFTETISPITNQLSIIKEEQGKQIEYTFNHELHGKVKIMIQLYNNPQVKNGIVINLENNASQAMGMLVYNYKPKYMVIPTVTTLYYKKLHNRLIKDTKKSKNIYKEQKTLVEKNEVWVKKKLNF